MKINIIGAGAIGTFYGGKLFQAGNNVQFYSKTQGSFLDKYQIQVKSIWGDFVFKAPFFNETSKMQKADLILITIKNIKDIDYKKLIQPSLTPFTAILVLQNGIQNEEYLQQLFPSQKIAGVLAFTCIQRTKPDIIEHLDYGHLVIAPLHKKDITFFQKIQSRFQNSGIFSSSEKNLKKARWTKLLWNIPFNPLSAIGEMNTKEIITNPLYLELVKGLMKETIRIAQKEGVFLTSLHIYMMLRRTKKMKPYYTSMYLDYTHGRKLEIDAILQNPMNIASKHKINTPYMNFICKVLTKHVS